jgi:hypothetical protein
VARPRSATHLYAIGLAPSGAGKDHPLQAIGEILVAANLENLLGPSEFISMPAVINFVQRQTLSICAMDEIGAWLKRLSNKNASTYEQSISKILRSLWGTSFKTYVTPEWAGRASVDVVNPGALDLWRQHPRGVFRRARRGRRKERVPEPLFGVRHEQEDGRPGSPCMTVR